MECVMLKIVSVCAAVILAAATFTFCTSVEALHRGPAARMGGAHISGARVGSVGGARMGSMAGPSRIGAYGGRGIYSGRGTYSGRSTYGGRAIYSGGRYASGYGRG